MHTNATLTEPLPAPGRAQARLDGGQNVEVYTPGLNNCCEVPAGHFTGHFAKVARPTDRAPYFDSNALGRGWSNHARAAEFVRLRGRAETRDSRKCG